MQYHKYDPNDNIIDHEPFKFKARTTGGTPAAGNTKDSEVAVPLKYFCRTLKISLVHYDINLMSTRSENCVITNSKEAVLNN